jgi:hypothetical protein
VQVASLGAEGLTAAAALLSSSQAANAPEVPLEMQLRVPIPDSANVPLIAVQTACNDKMATSAAAAAAPSPLASTATSSSTPIVDDSSRTLSLSASHVQALNQLPFAIQFDHIPSAFVNLTAHLDTSTLSNEQRLYLPLLLDVWFETSLLRQSSDQDDRKHNSSSSSASSSSASIQVIPFEQVINELEAQTVTYSCSMGSIISHLASLTIEMELDQYERCIEWYVLSSLSSSFVCMNGFIYSH